MAFSIDSRDIVGVHSYYACKVHWDKAEPWKGVPGRPLADRRKKHISMQQNAASYACRLYSTDIVTYHEDGSITLRCYMSQSTLKFAWVVRPTGCTPISHDGNMWWSVVTVDGNRYYTQGREPLKFKQVSPGVWELASKPAVLEERNYDPKLGAAARKLVKPYVDWYRLVDRLTGSTRSYSYTNTGLVQTLLANINDPQCYLEARDAGVSPEMLIGAAYKQVGAHYYTEAPADRLPRKN